MSNKKVGDMDLKKIQLIVEKGKCLDLETQNTNLKKQLLKIEQESLLNDMKIKYNLSDKDQVDLETGVITENIIGG